MGLYTRISGTFIKLIYVLVPANRKVFFSKYCSWHLGESRISGKYRPTLKESSKRVDALAVVHIYSENSHIPQALK